MLAIASPTHFMVNPDGGQAEVAALVEGVDDDQGERHIDEDQHDAGRDPQPDPPETAR